MKLIMFLKARLCSGIAISSKLPFVRVSRRIKRSLSQYHQAFIQPLVQY
jgi:hypothetical protein